MSETQPLFSEIWLADLDPTRGHEQAGKRPVLVISADLLNSGPAELVIVLPTTTVYKGIISHVEVNPPEGGLDRKSYIKCEDIRSISKERLTAKLGRVSSETMTAVQDGVRILLNL
jgi:mRNA interferase MazF